MQFPGQQVRAINPGCHGGVCMLSKASMLESPEGALCRLACDVISDERGREQSARSRPDAATVQPGEPPGYLRQESCRKGGMSRNKSRLFTGRCALGMKLPQPAEPHPSSSD